MAVGHKGQENACLLPMSCPHWASGGIQNVHTLKAGNKSPTMHNIPLALSLGHNHCGDVRRQPATWSQIYSASSGFGSHSRRVTLSRTAPARQFLSVTVPCMLSHVLLLRHTGFHTDPRPSFVVTPRTLKAKHAPYGTDARCVCSLRHAWEQAATTR